MLSKIRDVFSGLPRNVKRLLLIGFDAVALLVVMWSSFQLRLGGTFVPSLPQVLLMVLAPVLAIPIFIRMGLYRAVIRYLPDRAIWTIIQAMTLATLSWVAALFLAEATRLAVFPRSVPLLYLVFGTAVIAGSRFAARAVLWLPERTMGPEGGVVIYGAGAAGTQLAAALRGHGRNFVAAFLDDDSRLWGRDVAGYRVFPPANLGELVRNRGVREVILSIPSVSGQRRSEIVATLSQLPVKIRTLPAIADLVSGKYLISQLREIDIDDLLGRLSVPGNPKLFTALIEGRTILVTGAGGSIGGELTRLILRWKPKKLVLLEANEHALYQIERQLARMGGGPVRAVLGSIGDSALLARLFNEEAIEVVFHAAAHKHVPLVEANALEGVRNNVFGTQSLVEAAVKARVAHFVLISSDKAVRPQSVMGASKRWAELIVRHYGSTADGSRRRFCSVRFGNVLGSNGSVVPLFREQIATGGPVTLTDARMTRYFMSLHEAAELIVQAGALSEGGDIFLLEMGEPVKIIDLAENMIRLAGLTVRSADDPTGDIAIVETGARPGEKLSEELFFDPKNAEPTGEAKILRSPPAARNTGDLPEALVALKKALDAGDEAQLRQVLFALVEK